MSVHMTARKAAWLVSVAALAGAAHLWAGVATRQGDEYAITTPLAGDQVRADLALDQVGGYLVWQDNATDGHGLGISARRLDANLDGAYGVFRVNEIAAGDQENAKIALLKSGGAVVVWQGGTMGFQKVFARFLNASGTFLSGDVQVSSYAKEQQVEPAVAVLADGSVVVVWSSFGQDGSMFGVFGQRLSATGQKLGGEFAVNQATSYNQRSAAVTALPAGGFFVAWVSERMAGAVVGTDENGQPSDPTSTVPVFDIQVVGRRFDAQAVPVAPERRLSSAGRSAASPTLAASPSGRILLSYSGRDRAASSLNRALRSTWDIYSVTLDADGTALAPELVVNAHLKGDQFSPRAAALGGDFLVVWTSLGQDGSREGIYGRVVGLNSTVGEEIRINSGRRSRQVYPAVGGSSLESALVVWSTFLGGTASHDVHAQRFAAASSLGTPSAPFVSAVSQTRLTVTWPRVNGFEVAGYELYVDDAAVPIELAGNRHTVENLQPGSVHSFRLAYRLADGQKSPVSEASSGATWAEDATYDGLPDDWQARYWPGSQAAWPGAKEDSDGDGASNLGELLTGTDPTNPESVLRLRIDRSQDQGPRLSWAAVPGSVYQVQRSASLGTWEAFGPERFAAETTDSVPIDASSSLEMYRIIRIR